MAPPGGIWVSESVHHNVSNKTKINTEFVKTETLKNVKEPIKIFEIKLKIAKVALMPVDTDFTPPTATPAKKKPNLRRAVFIAIGTMLLLAAGYLIYNGFQKNKKNDPQSIAVLPFKDMSEAKDLDYLGDGIPEEILNVLTTIKDLKVIGRSSSFEFRKETDLRTIGKKLKVRTILEGSVRREGNQLRVSVNLINTEDGSQVWTQNFNRELKDIFILQGDIADTISQKLKLTLFHDPDNTTSRAPNPGAYETVLKGNFFFNRGEFDKAIDSYKKAIEMDSAYAYPYIRLGWAIYQLTLYNVYPSRVGFSIAMEKINKGLSLQPSISERQSAHHALAYINLWQYNWKNAWNEYEEVKKTDQKPNTVYAYYQAFVQSKTAEAVSEMEKSLDENPGDILVLRDFAVIQYLDREYAKARITCAKMLALDSGFSEAYRLAGSTYAAEGKKDLALDNFKKVSEQNPWASFLRIITLADLDQKEEARKLFALIDPLELPFKPPAIAKALIYYHLGETNKAFDLLNQSYDDRDFWLVSLKVDPLWDPLRSDPRFKQLMNKMSFAN